MVSLNFDDVDKNKLVLVGLDGATFTILKPWAEQGILPNIRDILDKGTSAVLSSTIPPFTPIAWTSMVTGKNPGKHGILNFLVKEPVSGKKIFVNNTLVKSKKLWNILNDNGLSTGIVNFPISYPPEKLKGFMISGFLTPKSAKDISFPDELISEIKEAIDDYIINTRFMGSGLQENVAIDFLERIHYQIEKRISAYHYLIDRYNPDFMMIVFMAIDQLQHAFWKYIDPQEQLYESAIGEKLRPYIVDVYKLIDNFLGDLVETMDEKGTLFIASDHGFTSLDKSFYMNKWLLDSGYLSLKRSKFLLSRIQKRLKRIIGKKNNTDVRIPFEELVSDLDQYIDWKRTIAYQGHAAENAIHINRHIFSDDNKKLSLGSLEELRDEIIDRISEINDEETGEKLVEVAFKREEVYQGPYVTDAPEILIRTKGFRYGLNNSINFREHPYFLKISEPAGCHHEDGILIGIGNNMKKGYYAGRISMEDVAPTVLYLMDLPIPDDMDGNVALSFVSDRYSSIHPVTFCPSSEGQRVECIDIFDEGSKDELAKQLKDLGYL